MGAGGVPGDLRWTGVGRVGRGNAGVGRLVPVFERDLRAEEAGSAHFISLYLATLVQRAAFDCFGGDWTVAVCRFFLAGAGTRLVDAPGQPPSSSGRNSATDMGRHAGYAEIGRA